MYNNYYDFTNSASSIYVIAAFDFLMQTLTVVYQIVQMLLVA